MSRIVKIPLVMLIAMATLAACKTDPAPRAGPRASTQPPALSTVLDLEAASRGRAIAAAGCASCHAIDAAGASPLPAAPPFREIVRRRALDDLETSFSQGLVTTHPAMPPYIFRASEIDDLIAYLDTF